MFVALGVAAIAFAGLAFAAGGNGWSAAGFGPQGWNGTQGERGMMRGWEGNGSCGGQAPPMQGLNGTRAAPPNMTAMKEAKGEFDKAVLSNDYSTAKNLSEKYGFGGPLFAKLNGTTFAKYSQIAALESQLGQELGINGTGMEPPIGRMGMGGPGMMGEGFAKGMRHGFMKGSLGINQTTQQ